ncbi:hypothetical protein PINS_up008375 [Pythium insidiosum]|nr:hypothetical protein PINS_up008375 [Pythium insidiosum]
MYHAAETDPMLAGARSPAKPSSAGTGSVRTMRLERPSPRCNDWFFALLFIVHVIAIAVFAGWKGVPAVIAHVKTHKNADNTVTTEKQADFTMVFSLAVALMGISVVVSALWMRFLMAYAASMIRIALWFNVGLVVVFAITSFSVSPLMAILFLGLAALNVCYIFAVQNRIAFASANLKTACAAVTDHMTIFLVALFMVVKQFAWLLLWSLSAIGVYQLFKESDPSCKDQPNALSRNGDDDLMPQHFCGGGPAGVALFFMLVSVYWGQQVIMNVLTCTTSGVVATWWYQANSKGATFGAMYRSLTTSFGSICFGSLIVAVLQALRTLASMLKEKAREDDNAALACVACLAECVLNCLEGIMEYINQWAYVYVGIYGYDFRTSGKAVMDLFANRGWTACDQRRSHVERTDVWRHWCRRHGLRHWSVDGAFLAREVVCRARHQVGSLWLLGHGRLHRWHGHGHDPRQRRHHGAAHGVCLLCRGPDCAEPQPPEGVRDARAWLAPVPWRRARRCVRHRRLNGLNDQPQRSSSFLPRLRFSSSLSASYFFIFSLAFATRFADPQLFKGKHSHLKTQNQKLALLR